MGDVPAQVCFSTTGTSGGSCTVLERVGSGATLPYQTAEVKIVTSNEGNSVVVVEATFSGGGSGLAREVSLWVYDAPGDSFQRAFRFELSELGSYQVVTSGPLTGYIMASDGIWLIGDEGHFDEHHFTIRLLGRPWNGSYREVLPYVATRKYDSETADASVLNAEAPTIGRPLGLAYPPNGLP